MDEKERILRKRVGKFHAVDTGKMDWRAYVDTGINHLLWSWPCKRKAKRGIVDCGDEQ